MAEQNEQADGVTYPVYCTKSTALSALVRFHKGELVECETAEEQAALLDYVAQVGTALKGEPIWAHYFELPSGVERGQPVGPTDPEGGNTAPPGRGRRKSN